MLMKYPNTSKNHLFFVLAFTERDPRSSAFYSEGKNSFINFFSNYHKLSVRHVAAETFLVKNKAKKYFLMKLLIVFLQCMVSKLPKT